MQADTTKEPTATDPENPAGNAVEKTEEDDQQEHGDGSKELNDNQGDEQDEQADEEQQNYGPDANGGFQNMNFQGSDDFNQMQMMMAMQNGMGANNFGGFPMMGT